MTIRIIGIIIAALGALSLIYGGFSYSDERTALQLGSIQLDVKEEKRVNIPVWGGLAALAIGGVLLVVGSGRRR